ncbi:hypothetical protein BRC82_07745 [Halobacteriales archaeon QS_1_67_19]|nr:MAG: hypothetical protein BRC82_07745 [Halobacteriales archaeon QS_1_67_19]
MRPSNTASKTVAGVPLLAGLGLGGWPLATHLRLTDRLASGHCDGCEPWHPLLVGAFVAGAALVALSVALARR